MGDQLREELLGYAWADEPEYGVIDRDTCVCKHPFAARSINRDGEPWAAYRAEAGVAPELLYLVALLNPPASDGDGAVGFVRFWIRFRPSTTDDGGFSMQSAEVSTGNSEFTELDHDQALAHPRIGEVWELVD